MDIKDIDRLFCKKDFYIDMVRRHINENYNLLPEEMKVVETMESKDNLPLSVVLKVWYGPQIIEYIEKDYLIDVRTKVQLLLHLKNRDNGKFIGLYGWYLNNIYNRPSVKHINAFENVQLIAQSLDEEGGEMKLHNDFVFKRTRWGFIIYEGSLVKVCGFTNTGKLEIVGPCNNILYEIISNKFFFDVHYSIYKGTFY